MQRTKTVPGAFWLAAVLAITSVSYASPAAAQEQQLKFELTPFAAYRFGGSFDDDDTGDEFDLEDSNALGVIFNILANPNGQYEILYARQDTEVDTEGTAANQPFVDLDVEYLQFGGTYLFDGDKVRPFIAMTFGLSHFEPQFADLDSENYFSASFGGGIKFHATETLGVRLEGRVFTTFLDSDSSIFCSSTFGAGECLVRASGSSLTQWEARAGLILRF
jgi:hypothetical protein